FDVGYQITESLIAIGPGGATGLGLGDGHQKLLFLPEAHTDYILAIVGEELGFVGLLCVAAAVVLLVPRGVRAVPPGRDAVARPPRRPRHRRRERGVESGPRCASSSRAAAPAATSSPASPSQKNCCDATETRSSSSAPRGASSRASSRRRVTHWSSSTWAASR